MEVERKQKRGDDKARDTLRPAQPATANLMCATSRPAPSPYNYYDELREDISAQSAHGKQSVDVIAVNMTCSMWNSTSERDSRGNIFGTNQKANEEQLIHLRHLALFVPLEKELPHLAVDTVSAMLLAVHHWNNGVSDIIPAIADFSQCPIAFTAEVLDPQCSSTEAARIMKEDIIPRLYTTSPLTREANATRQQESVDPSKPPVTAIISGLLSARTKPVSILANVYSIPVVSFSSQAAEFDNKDQYPYFGRTIPSNDVNAVVAAKFFKHVIKSTHVGLIYLRNDDGHSYARSFQEAAIKLDMRVTAASIHVDDQSSSSALSLLCEEWQLHHYVVVLNDLTSLKVMEMAAEMKRGCTGGGTFWMKADMASFPQRSFEVGSPLIEALNGTATMSFARTPSVMKGLHGYAAFTADASWPSGLRKDSEFAKYVQSKLPPTYFEDEYPNVTSVPYSDAPDPYVLMAYDTVIHIAMSACDAAKYGDRNDFQFDGSRFYEAFVRQEFGGIFGPVKVDNSTGSRVEGSLPYVVKNILANDPVDGMVSFRETPAYIYATPNRSAESSLSPAWRQIHVGTPFHFSDGTTVPPPSYPPPIVKFRTASLAVATFCGFWVAVAMLASLGFLSWVLRYRNESHALRASQPSFLIVMSIGTFIFASSMVPRIAVSYSSSPLTDYNEGEIISKPLWDFFCISSPWLFCVGFVLSFSSLCTKLKRVNRIFQADYFRRMVVRETDVILPFVALLSFEVSILFVWTMTSPPKYSLLETGARDKYGRVAERYPTCASETYDLAFSVLILMNLLVVFWANWEAYKARKVPSAYTESRYIAFSMSSILHAFLIGIPFFYVARDTQHYILVITILIVVIDLAILVPVFVPKLWFVHFPAGKSPSGNTSVISSIKGFQASKMDAGRPASSRHRDIVEERL